MKVFIFSIVLLVALCAPAQQSSTSNTTDPEQEDISALRAEVAEQRKQISELRAAVEKLLQDKAAATAATPTAQPVATTQHVAAPATAAAAQPTASDQKVSALQSVAERFRLSGDVRVRYDGVRQDYVQDRNRTLLRVRLGVEGKLGEDVSGGLFLATGSLGDNPTGTNQTFSEFFTRRAVGLDRGWITYNPKQAKWMELTGGKFAFTWNRTSLTFDSDLNPEGFSQKFTFKPKNGALKALTVTGLQLLFNEVAAPGGGSFAANDSFAVGGQVSGSFDLGNRVSTTVSGLALNWQNADPIATAMATRVLRSNLLTNATVGTGANTRFRSQFLYVDAIADNTIKTGSDRWPVRFLFEYLNNPRARTDENQAIFLETLLGRLQKHKDYQFGYSFARVEQDAVLAAFNESEFRAPTNVLQHRAFFQWMVQKNTTAIFTGWFGHTLDRNLQNAAVPPTLPAQSQDPYVKKLQMDVIYKF